MRHRRGFTMLELLVVIGILLLLIGMLFVGLRYLGAGGQVRSTQVTLDNLQSMLAEYEAAGNSLRRLSQLYADEGEHPLEAPGDVTRLEEENGERDGEAVHLTFEHVMEQLTRVPAVRIMMEQLPSELLMEDPEAGPGHVAHFPILLDAWGNPIIFVPGDLRDGTPGGLEGVEVGGQTITIRSPDGRPFFASAGPDGNFQTGDDNLYSFEN